MKKVTIYDIASACKVSPRTVTRAFKAEASVKPEIRQRILSEAAARDYHPNGIASRLAKPALHFIGVIVNVLPLFTRGIMRGFMEAQRELSDYKVEIDTITAQTPEEICACCDMLSKNVSSFGRTRVLDRCIFSCMAAEKSTQTSRSHANNKIIHKEGEYHMRNRIPALFLSISACFTLFTACSSVPGMDGSPATDVVTQAEDTAADTNYTAGYLPDENYDGYQFRMITTDDTICLSDVGEMNGEVLNDSFYTRNRKIEAQYNVNLVQTSANSWMDQAKILEKSVLAGTDDFDLIRLILREAFSESQNGMIAPLDALPYCDPSQPWYLSYMNDELTIGNKLYFAYTDECIGTYMYTGCIFFNKVMLGSLGLSSPYDAVNDGSWTMD